MQRLPRLLRAAHAAAPPLAAAGPSVPRPLPRPRALHVSHAALRPPAPHEPAAQDKASPPPPAPPSSRSSSKPAPRHTSAAQLQPRSSQHDAAASDAPPSALRSRNPAASSQGSSSRSTAVGSARPTAVAPAAAAAPPAAAEAVKPSLQERIKTLIAQAKFLFKFYLAGLKQLHTNRQRAKEIRAAALTRKEGEEKWSWAEGRVLRTHSADMRKLPLFLAILLILEELLPLVVIYAPGLLPSTCILPSQASKIQAKVELARAGAVQALRQHQADVHAALGAESAADTVDEGAALRKLDRERLVELAKMHALATWGPVALLVRRLSTHVAFIKADDASLAKAVQRGEIPDAELLVQACSERGLQASGIDKEEMRDNLRRYLGLPPSPLLRALTLYPHPTAASLAPLKAVAAEDADKGVMAKAKDVVHDVVEAEKRRQAIQAAEKEKENK